MKAILNCEYGVDNLQLRELEKPAPLDNEVLVRVRAASMISSSVSLFLPASAQRIGDLAMILGAGSSRSFGC